MGRSVRLFSDVLQHLCSNDSFKMLTLRSIPQVMFIILSSKRQLN